MRLKHNRLINNPPPEHPLIKSITDKRLVIEKDIRQSETVLSPHFSKQFKQDAGGWFNQKLTEGVFKKSDMLFIRARHNEIFERIVDNVSIEAYHAKN